MIGADPSGWRDRTHVGDCRHLLRQMAEDGVRVQICVTTPPYFGLRSYLPPDHPDKALEIGTETTPADFVASLVEVFGEVRRVLADDGKLWIVIGDSYAATGKSGGGRQGERWECHGAHVTGPRGGRWSPPPPGLKLKDLIGIPWLLAFALRRDGWFLRQDIIWAKPTPMLATVAHARTSTCSCSAGPADITLIRTRSASRPGIHAVPATCARCECRPVSTPPAPRATFVAHYIG